MNVFFLFFLSLRAGMPNRSITKTMLEDHALGQCFSTRGAIILFTNIMTRMLSHVKKYIA